MELTQELFQKCRRISAAIQDFLVQTGMVNARSTDVYEFLARKGLVEKDRHNGLHFRSFLKQLKDSNLLYLIKQCSCIENKNSLEWYFNPVNTAPSKTSVGSKVSVMQHYPVMEKQKLEPLLNVESANVELLPVREDIQYTSQQLEIKHYYPRAYEYWTDHEHEILVRVYQQCKNLDAVALLLKRQPHVVEEKIKILGL
jgi:hypothetical protein